MYFSRLSCFPIYRWAKNNNIIFCHDKRNLFFVLEITRECSRENAKLLPAMFLLALLQMQWPSVGSK